MGKYADAIQRGKDRGNAINITRETVSDKLRLLRAEKGYTQKQVAELTNIDPATYAGYENRISTPGLASLIRIAALYEVSLDFVVGRTDDRRGMYVDREELPGEALNNDDLLQRVEKLEQEMKEIKQS